MNNRLSSLDVLRGMTIILMILVNSPGSWDSVWRPLLHADWNGMTLTDMVFPCFLFIMGVTTYISLRKYQFRWSATFFVKVLRRSITLFVIGLALNYLSAHCPPLSQLRIMGVLQRFAICYFVVSLLAVSINNRWFPVIIAVLLGGYATLTLMCGGYDCGQANILVRVDTCLLGTNHMYVEHGLDPEGFLSTLPSIAHTMIGYCVGRMALAKTTLQSRINNMTIVAILMLFSGLLLAEDVPLNKKIWSATYVFVTCGLSLLMLVLLGLIIDVKSVRFPQTPFLVFGVNPLFCYALGELTNIFMYWVTMGGTPLHDVCYGWLAAVAGDNAFTSLVYSFLMVGFVGMWGYVLYRRRIYIKI